MSIVKAEDNKKWINTLIVLVSVLLGYIVIVGIGALGEIMELESRIPNFSATTQGVGFLAGVLSFLIIWKNVKVQQYLDEVYGELVKVVWPDKDSIVKLTFGIVIGLIIVSGILVFVDYIFRQLLSLIY
jgi:preprotein translocase subunit SecE